MSEKRFLSFQKNLINELSNKDWKSNAHFFTCESFYDFFIGCFQYVQYPDYNLYTDESEFYIVKGNQWFISNNKFKRFSDKETDALLQILNKIGGSDAANIETTRGHAYLIFKDYDTRKKTSDNENDIIVFSNSPTGKEDNIPRLLINQVTPKTFVILPLKEMKETEFEPNKFRFSFGIPCSVFPSYSGIGDIFFFNESGLEFSRINIIDAFNSNEFNVETIGHKFDKTNLQSLFVSLFQEDSFTYKINVSETAYAGRLRERWSSFSARFNLKENQWFNLVGDSSLESLK